MGVLAISLSVVATIAGGPAAASLAASHPCDKEIRQQLESWRVTDEILRAPGGPHGGDVFRIATENIAVWVTLHLSRGPQASVSLFLTDPDGTTRLDYGESCEPASARIDAPDGPGSDEVFTDARLKALLAEDPRLIVYLWSPHLPLSVDGFREIEGAASSLGIRVVGVVDPSATKSYVESTGDEVGIPRGARRMLGSVELLFRDLAVHAPSILVFTDGKASAPLPGYRNADAYRAHIREFLKASD